MLKYWVVRVIWKIELENLSKLSEIRKYAIMWGSMGIMKN